MPVSKKFEKKLKRSFKRFKKKRGVEAYNRLCDLCLNMDHDLNIVTEPTTTVQMDIDNGDECPYDIDRLNTIVANVPYSLGLKEKPIEMEIEEVTKRCKRLTISKKKIRKRKRI